MSNGENQPYSGPGGWAPPSSAPGAYPRPGSAAPAAPGQGYPGQLPLANPMPVSARPASAPTQYGRPVSAPLGPPQSSYPPARQGMPASAPPGYPLISAPNGYGPPPFSGAPGVFAPQHQRYYPGPGVPQHGNDNQHDSHKPRGKKKRSLWDAFLGDLGKNKRSGGDESQTSDRQHRSRNERRPEGGNSGPLAAYGSLDNRMDMSAGVLAQRLPGFRVEDGVVVPDDARLHKARRRGPGVAGGRWQRFAFLTAMLLAMALLMVLGVSRLIGDALGSDPKLPAGYGFPREAAAGYVERLNKAFFTWDADDPRQRQRVLSTYYPFSDDSQYGWNSAGKQEVRDMPVTVRMDVDTDEKAIVTTVMSVVTGAGTPDEQVSSLCAATSVVAKTNNAIAVNSYPALVACPAAADAGVSEEQAEADNDNRQDIKAQVDRFFAAYADSDEGLLKAFTTEEKIIEGLGGGREFDENEGVGIKVLLPEKGADPNVREARVAVQWLQPQNAGGGSTISEYLITVKKVDGDWKISKLRPALPSSQLQPESGAEQRDGQRAPANLPADDDSPADTDPQPGAASAPAGGGP